jgi:tRNA nucleotidyltransferase (CCA-adding enzyme)
MRKYLVGGAVRDEILGVRSKDLDYTVVLDESDNVLDDPFVYMSQALIKEGFKVFTETPEFLTVRAKFPNDSENKGQTADFVLARKEGIYTDGRRPDKVEIGTLEDDLRRRDFTMNAIAKDADGNYIDPFNGRGDIARRLIRAVGDPLERLTEDALRAVRAVRFAVTKGFDIEASLWDALQDPVVLDLLVNKISDERIGAAQDGELSKMFRFDTVASLNLLSRMPLLTEAVFAGSVSLDSTMKTKGRGK